MKKLSDQRVLEALAHIGGAADDVDVEALRVSMPSVSLAAHDEVCMALQLWLVRSGAPAGAVTVCNDEGFYHVEYGNKAYEAGGSLGLALAEAVLDQPAQS